MKKIIILALPILIITGCSTKEKIFEKYGREYYEKHMIMVNNIDTVTITLNDLMNTKDNYNLKKLNKCDKNSKIIFSINKETKNIENKKIDLKC